MIQKHVAILCALLLLGGTSSAFGAEYVNQNYFAKIRPSSVFSPPISGAQAFSSKVALGAISGRLAAFSPLPQGQQPSQTQSQPKHLTGGGKAMVIVGIVLIVSGGLTAAAGKLANSNNTGCGSGYGEVSCSTVSGVYYGLGGAQVVTGALLLVFGSRRKE
jgi:hypothetical protein